MSLIVYLYSSSLYTNNKGYYRDAKDECISIICWKPYCLCSIIISFPSPSIPLLQMIKAASPLHVGRMYYLHRLLVSLVLINCNFRCVNLISSNLSFISLKACTKVLFSSNIFVNYELHFC